MGDSCANNGDSLVRVVSHDGRFRAVAAATTALVAQICARQGTDPTATVALGRLLTGGALLSCLLKGRQRLALVVEGNGPLGKLSVEAEADGRIRGTIRHPVAGLPPRGDRFDVAGAIGKAGFLHVWKDLGLKQPYQSMVQLQTSEIGEDLAWYLTTSEQVPSSVGLGVELDQSGAVAVAGGFLIQALPPEHTEGVNALIERIRGLPPTTRLLRQGLSPLQILERLFGGTGFAVQHDFPLRFSCPCSRAQIEDMLIGLGRTELDRLAGDTDPVEVTCEYCRQAYAFSSEELRTLRSRASE